MLSWKREPRIDSLAPVLRQWFESDLGRAVLDAELDLIGSALADCFGYHLLQLSVDNNLKLHGDCRVQRCFAAGPVSPQEQFRGAFAQCNFHELPFESDSLDVVIVHHVLEFAADPHAVLRELYRVTVPHGRILVMGFNPWSLFGARMRLGSWRRDSVWRNHLLSAPRVSDWLQLLGFANQQTDFGFYRLPFRKTLCRGRASSERSRDQWARHVPFGGVYLITAVKQESKFIPLKPRWSRPAVLSALPVVKPSASAGQHQAREANGKSI